MIQRIQSVWLLLAGSLGLLSLKFPFFSGHRINDAVPKPIVFVSGTYNILLIVFTTTVAITSLFSIFLYKNRGLQLRAAIVALLGSILNIGLYFWQKQAFVQEESSISITALIAFFVPVLLTLAIRGIWKDEKLVKSADRLR
ncbi:MAG: DUF4293 domain-containing protein [Sphingobacteriia bacterium]|nr:DUF4293 domain-containing protein [Sphingobacteriia bacterium]